MTRIFLLRFALFCGVGLTLGACGTMRETFGLNRHAPDEFAVATRAPLEIPPEFRLYPPTPGAPRPQEMRADDTAKIILSGQEKTPPATTSWVADHAEDSLLEHAGADKADPDIRAKVAREQGEEGTSAGPTINRIIDLGSKEEEKGVVIDPRAEAERLKQHSPLKK